MEAFAAACGQLTKLEYATTAPEAATDRDWPGLAGLEHSNWTPKNMKALELILQHVQAGEKILVGSDLIETGRWLCDRLKEKGVRAGHIVEEKNGKPATVNPKKRAVVMRDFRHGSLQVLLCGIPAIRLGHTSTLPQSSWSTGSCSPTRCSISSSPVRTDCPPASRHGVRDAHEGFAR